LPTPFPARPNDREPQIAKAIAKRLSKLMFDPQYSALVKKSPGWGTLVADKYNAAIQALTPPPQGGAPGQPPQQEAQPQRAPTPVASPIQGPQPKMPNGSVPGSAGGRAA